MQENSFARTDSEKAVEDKSINAIFKNLHINVGKYFEYYVLELCVELCGESYSSHFLG